MAGIWLEAAGEQIIGWRAVWLAGWLAGALGAGRLAGWLRVAGMASGLPRPGGEELHHPLDPAREAGLLGQEGRRAGWRLGLAGLGGKTWPPMGVSSSSVIAGSPPTQKLIAYFYCLSL